MTIVDELEDDPSGPFCVPPVGTGVGLDKSILLPAGTYQISASVNWFHGMEHPNLPEAFCRDSIVEGEICFELEVDTCPWDLDGDGRVQGSDLLILLNAWGDCRVPACASDLSHDLLCQTDFTQDGVTSGQDHLMLLNRWGDCFSCEESAGSGGAMLAGGANAAMAPATSDDPMIQMMLTLAEATQGDVPQTFLEEFWAYMDATYGD